MATYRVAVHTYDIGTWQDNLGRSRRRPLVLAYLRHFGAGHCLHVVEASNGAKAKAVAIAEHRARCMGAPEAP